MLVITDKDFDKKFEEYLLAREEYIKKLKIHKEKVKKRNAHNKKHKRLMKGK